MAKDQDQPGEDAIEPTPFDNELQLTEGEERLPWLESGDDDDEDSGDAGRMITFVIGGLVLLAALIFGIYKITHNRPDPALADGAVIKAPAEPYKTAPAKPGGKPMAGTGDTSYAVSAGQTKTPKLGDAPVKAAAGAASGPAVQLGAFSSQAKAEAAWTQLSAQHEALKGLQHRVVSGSADIGTVYRLLAATGDATTANALCAKLRGASVACQVK